MNLSRLDVANHHSSDRLFEWIMALMMLAIAATLALPGDTIANGPQRGLLAIGLDETKLMLFFGVTGAYRCAALWANGRWRVYGPRIRAVGATGGALVWAQMASVLVYESSQAHWVSLGVPVYLALMVGELLSCYRATYDAGYRGA